MSQLMRRIKRFSRSPQGRRLIHTARRAALDPRRRTRSRGLLGRLRRH
ncbi:hypothetical protein [Streptomyces roseolilacinus]|uniref:Uncharacterized protein n=1 Tax=Streptomyces roseolilacinus TaxID=66904 RepID=A0A918AWW8_9ACTN|nr:hypothetical protein [Streptomyces roseolilacinus]GGP93833.1 hypothetical protein GCM10010249_09480 [Streptomyces roseolilacinus]